MPREPAIDLLRRETRVRYGPVPHVLGGQAIPAGSDYLDPGNYVLRTSDGVAYHYARGEGIAIERAPDCDLSVEALYLNGSVYAAVASLLGLFPLHASAVAYGGKVFAISGPSGAGKSTLAAGLGQLGLPLFCDDTLILDIADPGRVLCLPGHKRLKLHPDAIAMTGASAQEPVASDIDKVYALPPCGTADTTLPLGELLFLEPAETLAIMPIPGGERIARLEDDHYTGVLFRAASRASPTERFSLLTQLARTIPMRRLAVPRGATRFAATLAAVADHIRAATGEPE